MKSGVTKIPVISRAAGMPFHFDSSQESACRSGRCRIGKRSEGRKGERPSIAGEFRVARFIVIFVPIKRQSSLRREISSRGINFDLSSVGRSYRALSADRPLNYEPPNRNWRTKAPIFCRRRERPDGVATATDRKRMGKTKKKRNPDEGFAPYCPT